MAEGDAPLTVRDPWRGAAALLGFLGGFALVDLLWIALTHAGMGHHPAVEPWDLAFMIGKTGAALLGAYALWSHWRLGRRVVLLWALASLVQIGIQTADAAERHGMDGGLLFLAAVQAVAVLSLAVAIWHQIRTRPGIPLPPAF